MGTCIGPTESRLQIRCGAEKFSVQVKDRRDSSPTHLTGCGARQENQHECPGKYREVD